MASRQFESRPQRWRNAWWWLGFALSVVALVFLPWPIGAAMLLVTIAGWRGYRYLKSRP
jgi:hypothetical protein